MRRKGLSRPTVANRRPHRSLRYGEMVRLVVVGVDGYDAQRGHRRYGVQTMSRTSEDGIEVIEWCQYF